MVSTKLLSTGSNPVQTFGFVGVILIVNVTSPAPKLPEKEKIVLEINTPNWERVLSYIAKNKADGLEKIVKALEQKYQIKAQVKKAISNALKDE